VYDRILLPTDGHGSDAPVGRPDRPHSGDGGERRSTVLDHALSLAERYDATLHAVFVVDTSTGWLTVSKAEVRDALDEVGRDAGRTALGAVEAAATDAGVDVVTDLLEGSPDERLVEYVAANGVDLVVMGTAGRSGVGRRLLGSVTERVVRASPVPTVAVPTAGGRSDDVGN
jgi:nucleotide-binding universal stress UspA family protein